MSEYYELESALRHRRIDDESKLNCVCFHLDRHTAKPKRRFFTLRRALLIILAIVSFAVLRKFGYVGLPYPSSISSWDPLPERGSFINGPDVKKRDAIVEAFRVSISEV
ncbi:mannosyl-oligosaccharide alpha-1,2-mannosidase [Leucoagaricus gongylophorus]